MTFFSSVLDDTLDAETVFLDEDENHEEGWYFWFCRPGCLPDHEMPFGPFPTEEAAIHACREMVND